MQVGSLTLHILENRLAVCRLEPESPMPDWALHSPFFSLTKTEDEISIICNEDSVPEDAQTEGGWRAFKVQGPLEFSQTGILSSLASPLAIADISIFALSTFETDYLLVKEDKLEKASEILCNFCRIEG